MAAAFDATGERVVTASGWRFLTPIPSDNTARIWKASRTGQALLDQVRTTLGRRAPDPLKFPDQTSRQEGYMNAIARGLNIIWTRTVAALPWSD